MSVNSMGTLNVSPYLTSAMSRIQSNELAAKSAAQSSSANNSNAAQTSGSTSLGNQAIGTLVDKSV